MVALVRCLEARTTLDEASRLVSKGKRTEAINMIAIAFHQIIADYEKRNSIPPRVSNSLRPCPPSKEFEPAQFDQAAQKGGGVVFSPSVIHPPRHGAGREENTTYIIPPRSIHCAQ